MIANPKMANMGAMNGNMSTETSLIADKLSQVKTFQGNSPKNFPRWTSLEFWQSTLNQALTAFQGWFLTSTLLKLNPFQPFLQLVLSQRWRSAWLGKPWWVRLPKSLPRVLHEVKLKSSVGDLSLIFLFFQRGKCVGASSSSWSLAWSQLPGWI